MEQQQQQQQQQVILEPTFSSQSFILPLEFGPLQERRVLIYFEFL
jgi:hypothetical protein